MGTIDFPTWFSYGCYGGLACCMCAMAMNALFTALRKRGTTRQLAGAIVSSVISALLVLPAILWYHRQFNGPTQIALSPLEVGFMLAYVAIWGWAWPFGVTVVYFLFTRPRDSNTDAHLQGQRKKRSTNAREEAVEGPKQRQPGVLAPFVYSADTAWGWLEYNNGNFLGQELALKRSVVSIGREEDNEIWLDDDMISRYHAELSWEKGQAYVTDCGSLNGISLNGQRVHASLLVKHGDVLEIGANSFLMKYAQQPLNEDDLDDPLLPQLRRISQSRHTSGEYPPQGSHQKELALPTVALSHDQKVYFSQEQTPTFTLPVTDVTLHETIELSQNASQSHPSGFCLISNGETPGHRFLLNNITMTIGRGPECNVVLQDASISRCHAQFSHQFEGDYVQDLNSRNGSQVNGEPLSGPRLLKTGDVILLGSVRLEYTLIYDEQTRPVSSVPSLLSPLPVSLVAPSQLRLPDRLKEQL